MSHRTEAQDLGAGAGSTAQKPLPWAEPVSSSIKWSYPCLPSARAVGGSGGTAAYTDRLGELEIAFLWRTLRTFGE